ncbi:peroxisomal biogenesis factor 1 [Cavenderia fasciculata]|uniref:Peroxisomal ATPase PEX1 n=1 Tax=Cavenderia fasciculata TaxID=261658 RepID=F4PSY5_CACFS|nr:peroxisomal biogenesis factor 1 [Cavenderia fasciculata]EGG20774.1 peroxisomal biogenesis factor 1 [Cavenderia fasciculata]|eukprot:XP_004358624.1 peroxisomal biogenesis factor 1 [Cavenderia fasciculata]
MDLYVTLRHSPNCFVNLPLKIAHTLAQRNESTQLILELKWYDKANKEDKYAFVGWSGGSSSSMGNNHHHHHNDSLEMSQEMAQCLGLVEGQMIRLKAASASAVQKATTVEVEPVTSDDWEILEVHAEYLEEQLLNQINVVSSGQIIPIWIHQKIVIHLRVIDVTPKSSSSSSSNQPSAVKLSNDSEIIVAPKPRNIPSSSSSSSSRSYNSLLPRHLYIQQESSLVDSDNNGLLSSTTVYISLNAMKEYEWNQGDIVEISQIKSKDQLPSILQSSSESTDAEDNQQQQQQQGQQQQQPIIKRKCIYARVYSSQEVVGKLIVKSDQHIIVGKNLRYLLQLNVNTQIKVRILPSHSIPICPISGVQIKQVVWRNSPLEFAPKPPRISLLPPQLLHQVVKEWSHIYLKENNKDNQQQPKAMVPLVNGSIITIPPIKNYSTNSIDIQFHFNQQQQQQQMSSQQQQQGGGNRQMHPQQRQNNQELLNVIGNVLSNQIDNLVDQPNPQQQQQQQSSQSSQQNQYQLIHGVFMINDEIFNQDRMIISFEKNDGSKLEPLEDYVDISDRLFDRIGGMDKLIDQAKDYLSLLVRKDYGMLRNQLNAPGNGGVLITGSHGSGKSMLASALAGYYVHLDESLTFVVRLNCQLLKETKVERIRQTLTPIFTRAYLSKPSIIILEDLDIILPNPNEQDPGSKIRCLQISNYIKKLIGVCRDRNAPIVLIATSQSIQSLYKDFQTPDVMGLTLEIQPPSRDDRADIFFKLLKRLDLQVEDDNEKVALGRFASSLEGYLGCDIERLIERVIYLNRSNSNNNNNPQQSTVTLKGMHLAKEGYTPISLKGVKLHQSDAGKWNDIGGLKDGPELLNKYIGSSEQGVRDIFSRASSASPCVLFFDEFDSIAPRRGHDSTGVTDRVVNQFLTELDGVEGLAGVYVLAATSRPDLIDPALLRPGRLDKSLYCNIPERDERLEIITILANKMRIDEESQNSLAELADTSEGYTGADLRAIMYNSQLKSIHELMHKKEQEKKEKREKEENDKQLGGGVAGVGGESILGNNIVIFENIENNNNNNSRMTNEQRNKLIQKIDEIKTTFGQQIDDENNNRNNNNNSNGNNEQPIIKKIHFEESFKQSSPSVPPSERTRYEKIYKNFLKERGSVTGTKKEGMKQTLA